MSPMYPARDSVRWQSLLRAGQRGGYEAPRKFGETIDFDGRAAGRSASSHTIQGLTLQYLIYLSYISDLENISVLRGNMFSTDGGNVR